MKIKAGGFCHSDVMAHNGVFGTNLPYIGSHEPAGVIEEVGSDVKNFKVGDKVGALPYGSCCGIFSPQLSWRSPTERDQANAQTARPTALYSV